MTQLATVGQHTGHMNKYEQSLNHLNENVARNPKAIQEGQKWTLVLAAVWQMLWPTLFITVLLLRCEQVFMNRITDYFSNGKHSSLD